VLPRDGADDIFWRIAFHTLTKLGRHLEAEGNAVVLRAKVPFGSAATVNVVQLPVARVA
jgi:hypothetical protein